MEDFTGVVVAAGQSVRFGGGVPKQFLPLAGRTMIEWSVQLLSGRPGVRGVIVVLPRQEADGPRGALVRSWPGVLEVVAGGPTRAASVWAGLEAAGESRFLLVHDAARPLATSRLTDAVISATRSHGAAAPVLTVSDTVKELDEAGWIARTLARSLVGLSQTPQGARGDWLRSALERARREGVEPTDEAAALEHDGRKVAVVAGEPANRKITQPGDLVEVLGRLRGEPADLRVGTGFDIHRLGAARPLVLGGIEFAGQPGLIGHSDGDVVLHAAMDALLGASGQGDIGVHFPSGDPRYAGIASTELARQVAELLSGLDFEVLNLDLTVLAEQPTLRPFVERMRQTIGSCFRVDPARIGVKATTLEGLGSLGRGEGIACQAVALLHLRRSPRP